MEIYFKGEPMHLEGEPLEAGDRAPDFVAVTRQMAETRLSDFTEPVRVITSFPSLDTPVCQLQLKQFNQRAASLSPRVRVIGISKDLPFAQERFCAMNGIDRVTVLSDYRYDSFGENYRLLVRELKLLARAVLILKGEKIAWASVNRELTEEPDYEAVMAALEPLAG